MKGFVLIELNDMIKEIGEEKVELILSDFSCFLNKDVEYFLQSKAIQLGKMGISRTYLVFRSYKKKAVLVGYFALTTKIIFVARKALSSNLRGKIGMFAKYNEDRKGYEFPVPLIGQLGKNLSIEKEDLISGDELLKMACDKIAEAQRIVGGKFTYLECEELDKLKDFYERNGFVCFGRRRREKEEEDRINGEYLSQMLKYIKQ